MANTLIIKYHTWIILANTVLILLQIEQGQDCMLDAVLSQVDVPSAYLTDNFRMQLSGHMAKFPHYFSVFFGPLLAEKRESYSSYIHRIARGDIWGDVCLLQVVAQMWSLKITIIQPLKSSVPVWHKSTEADSDIVIIYNGRDHYSGTSK